MRRTNVSGGEPSPQVTLTSHGPLPFASLNEPSWKLLVSPSSETWFAGPMYTGGAFASSSWSSSAGSSRRPRRPLRRGSSSSTRTRRRRPSSRPRCSRARRPRKRAVRPRFDRTAELPPRQPLPRSPQRCTTGAVQCSAFPTSRMARSPPPVQHAASERSGERAASASRAGRASGRGGVGPRRDEQRGAAKQAGERDGRHLPVPVDPAWRPRRCSAAAARGRADRGGGDRRAGTGDHREHEREPDGPELGERLQVEAVRGPR